MAATTRGAPPSLALIFARARNGVIGRDGGLPWRLAGDLAAFRRLTMGAPVLMGRKTWDSLPRRPLPGRAAIVLSRAAAAPLIGARVFSDFPAARAAALAMAAASGRAEAFVIGGAALYALALPEAERCYVTEVEAAPAGDCFAPPLGPDWRLMSNEAFPADADNEYAYALGRWERQKPAIAY